MLRWNLVSHVKGLPDQAFKFRNHISSLNPISYWPRLEPVFTSLVLVSVMSDAIWLFLVIWLDVGTGKGWESGRWLAEVHSWNTHTNSIYPPWYPVGILSMVDLKIMAISTNNFWIRLGNFPCAISKCSGVRFTNLRGIS